MKNLLLIPGMVLLLASPASADSGFHVSLDLPIIHGGFAVDVGSGAKIAVIIPVVQGGAEIGVLTPEDAVAVGVTLPVVKKGLSLGCCKNLSPY